MSPIRLGLVGAGRIAQTYLEVVSELDDFDLVAVVDPVADARQKLAGELGVQACDDHRALRGQIDAAVIATPTIHHHQVGMELLLAGVHLLVEKPLATSLCDAEELVQCAAINRRTLQVGHIEQ